MTQTHEVTPAIQALLDKQALTDLLGSCPRLSTAVITIGSVSCYAEESFDDHGFFKGPGREFADLICQMNSVGAL